MPSSGRAASSASTISCSDGPVDLGDHVGAARLGLDRRALAVEAVEQQGRRPAADLLGQVGQPGEVDEVRPVGRLDGVGGWSWRHLGRLYGVAVQRVLAVYAHPDDPEVSCAGTLARWADEGAEVHLVICARGDKGTPRPGRRPGRADRACGPTRPTPRPGARPGQPREPRPARRRGRQHARAAGPAGRAHPRPAARRGRVVRPDRGVLRQPLRQPPRPPRGRVRRARRLRRRPPPARSTSPRPARPTRSARSTCRARSSPTPGRTSRRTLDRKVEALRCHRSQVGDDLDLVGEVVRRRAASAGRRGRPGATPSAFRVLRFRLTARRSRDRRAAVSAPGVAWPAAMAGRSGPVGRRWIVRHSPMARRASTTTTATPPAPMSAPTRAPMASGVRAVAVALQVGEAVADERADGAGHDDGHEPEHPGRHRRQRRRWALGRGGSRVGIGRARAPSPAIVRCVPARWCPLAGGCALE